MLTKREAFKIGFMRKCANDGMTPKETHKLVKKALNHIKKSETSLSDLFMKPYNKIVDVGGEVAGDSAKTLGNLGIASLILGPPAIGGGIGYLASRATDIDDTDVESLKKRELIEEYRRQAEKMRRKKMNRRLLA